MKVVVTGSEGFIGSYLVKALGESLSNIIDGKTSAVVNLEGIQPARGDFSPLQYTYNLNSLLELLETCQERGVPRIVGIYSQLSELETTRFSDKYGPFSLIEETCKGFLEYYNRKPERKMKNVILVVPPVIGIGPFLWNSGLGTFISKARMGETIEVWGTEWGVNLPRDLLYIKDLIEALLVVLKNPDLSGAYYIHSDSISLWAEASTTSLVFGAPSKYSRLVGLRNKPNGVRHYPDPELSTIPDWIPKFTFKQMLEDIKEDLDVT